MGKLWVSFKHLKWGGVCYLSATTHIANVSFSSDINIQVQLPPMGRAHNKTTSTECLLP